MAFKKGESASPTTQFSSENQPPPEAKTHGYRRSDIARKVLSLRVNLDAQTAEQLRQSFPEIGEVLTGEELATLIQLNKSIILQDTAAYRAILDSAYGAPKQELGMTDTEGKDVAPVTVFQIPDNGRG